MSGHHSFDHTVHAGNIWSHKNAVRRHVEDRGHGYTALRATPHVLRGRLSPQNAVHLNLPMDGTTLTEGVFDAVGSIRSGGGHGSTIGRNSIQRPRDEALAMLDRVTRIYLGDGPK